MPKTRGGLSQGSGSAPPPRDDVALPPGAQRGQRASQTATYRKRAQQRESEIEELQALRILPSHATHEDAGLGFEHALENLLTEEAEDVQTENVRQSDEETDVAHTPERNEESNSEREGEERAEVNAEEVLGHNFEGQGDVGQGEEGEAEEEAPRGTQRRAGVRPDTRIIRGINKIGPFPGGPENHVLLRNFYDHTALRTYIGDVSIHLICLHYNHFSHLNLPAQFYTQERVDLLKPVHHIQKMKSWDLENECELVRMKFSRTGLAFLQKASGSISKLMVTAFVERWHPETNTFHMPFGEMTITLEDVERITGLKIDGTLPVASVLKKNTDASDLLVRTLGIKKEAADEELKGRKTKGTVRIDWLKQQLSGYVLTGTDRVDAKAADKVVRGYCLYLLGCTLFCDKSGYTISVGWLQFLKDVERIDDYAWGTAGLAYFYRHLGMATRGDNKQIAGLSMLLEVCTCLYLYCSIHNNMNSNLKQMSGMGVRAFPFNIHSR